MIFGKDKEKMNKLEHEVGNLKYQLAETKKEIIDKEKNYHQARNELETHYKDEETKINSDYQKLEEIIKEKYLSGDKKAKTNIKKSLEADIFFNKIYKHFTKNFTDKIGSLRFNRTELNPEDKSWLFQNALEIAMHTADYTEHYVKEDREYYHNNYELLKNDLSLSEANKNGYDLQPREFIENDMECSTRASNGIYKACKSFGIKAVRFLVDKFNISEALKK